MLNVVSCVAQLVYKFIYLEEYNLVISKLLNRFFIWRKNIKVSF